MHIYLHIYNQFKNKMEIIEKVEEGNVLRILVNSNEESLFSLLKVYLENESDVDIVGVYKEHHLIDKTEFLLKTKILEF